MALVSADQLVELLALSQIPKQYFHLIHFQSNGDISNTSVTFQTGVQAAAKYVLNMVDFSVKAQWHLIY
jgi:hypothetical protein